MHFQFNQLKIFYNKQGGDRTFGRSLTKFEKLCNEQNPPKNTLLCIYKNLIDSSNLLELSFLKTWNRDLDANRTEEEAKDMICTLTRCSRCSRIQELNYKILTKWYHTPSRLHKMFPKTTRMCWRCKEEEGTLLHILWSCPMIVPYWNLVLHICSHIANGRNLNNPLYSLLFHMSQDDRLNFNNSALPHLLNSAKLLIPRYWKSTQVLSVKEWLMKVEEIQQFEERSTFTMKHKTDYTAQWSTWLLFKGEQEYKQCLNYCEGIYKSIMWYTTFV